MKTLFTLVLKDPKIRKKLAPGTKIFSDKKKYSRKTYRIKGDAI